MSEVKIAGESFWPVVQTMGKKCFVAVLVSKKEFETVKKAEQYLGELEAKLRGEK